MTNLATNPRRGGREPAVSAAVFKGTIAGRFRRITTQQIALAWWLHQAGHITRRQLRLWFAAHEMAERRRYTSDDRTRPTKPHYRLEEVRSLVGGRTSPTAERDLRADLRHLAATGLVSVDATTIRFAERAEDLSNEIDLTGFWDFFRQLPNRQRTVPVPRRTLRALAAGLRRAETAYVLAALIRSVFWHKETKRYRTDGRTKLSWISQVFGISRRAVTDARARLIELGWIQPLEAPQWALNRWGVHEAVQVDHTLQEAPERESDLMQSASTCPVGEGSAAGQSASPSVDLEAGSASLYLNRSSSSTRNQENRTLGGSAPGPSGLSLAKRIPKKRKKSQAPSLRDIQSEDLGRPEAVSALRAQALERGFRFAGEAGEIDFFALAHRARVRGARPGALFFDLIANHRVEFITLADEEAARAQLRELREGPTVRSEDPRTRVAQPKPELSMESRIVGACLEAARVHGFQDPFRVAQMGKGWTRQQWDDAHLRYVAELGNS